MESVRFGWVPSGFFVDDRFTPATVCKIDKNPIAGRLNLTVALVPPFQMMYH
jgi:hypothetical protein